MAAPTKPTVGGPGGRAPGGRGGGWGTGGPENGVFPFGLLFPSVHLVYVESGARPVADIATFTKFRIGLRHRMSQRRKVLVTRRAGRSSGRDGTDRSLRIQHGIQAFGEVGFRGVDMAHVAFGRVVDFARRRHGRITHASEIVVAAAEPDNDVGPVKGLHGYAGVDLVDHQGEVDRLRWQGFVRYHDGVRTLRTVVLARVVAQHAHFDLVAVFAVKG